jgi:hypothetical protein
MQFSPQSADCFQPRPINRDKMPMKASQCLDQLGPAKNAQFLHNLPYILGMIAMGNQ